MKMKKTGKSGITVTICNTVTLEQIKEIMEYVAIQDTTDGEQHTTGVDWTGQEGRYIVAHWIKGTKPSYGSLRDIESHHIVVKVIEEDNEQ